ncbi:MAG: mechanosensitive ion channel domain-containing protein [Pseudohongiellaceae bacterium]
MENISFDLDTLAQFAIVYGIQLLLAILVLVIGLYAVSVIMNVIKRAFVRSRVDLSLQGFLNSFLSILLKIMVYITAVSMLGVEMTSFVAILAAAGLAVGLALSGTLQNFAGGVIVLLFKPYRVGDFIEAQGFAGMVNEIQIFDTILTTPDNKTVIIPNGPLATDALVNYSTQPTRRVEWTFGIAYGDDVDKAYAVLDRLITADARILNEPVPFRAVSALADSSVDIVVRVWVNSADFWQVFVDMNEQVYKTFVTEGLTIPFPQRDVHLFPAK